MKLDEKIQTRGDGFDDKTNVHWMKMLLKTYDGLGEKTEAEKILAYIHMHQPSYSREPEVAAVSELTPVPESAAAAAAAVPAAAAPPPPPMQPPLLQPPPPQLPDSSVLLSLAAAASADGGRLSAAPAPAPTTDNRGGDENVLAVQRATAENLPLGVGGSPWQAE